MLIGILDGFIKTKETRIRRENTMSVRPIFLILSDKIERLWRFGKIGIGKN